MMKARINARIPLAHDMEALKVAIQEEWDWFTPTDFEKIIRSMPNRMKECIKNRGGATHY